METSEFTKYILFFQRKYFSDQSKYNFLLDRLRDKKNDMSVQNEVLGVLVRTIEEEHSFMEVAVKDAAARAILEIQNELNGPRIVNFAPSYKEIEENCRLGLGMDKNSSTTM